MNAICFGGSLDGKMLDVQGISLHNLVGAPGAYDTEIYEWDYVNHEYFLIIAEVHEGAK